MPAINIIKLLDSGTGETGPTLDQTAQTNAAPAAPITSTDVSPYKLNCVVVSKVSPLTPFVFKVTCETALKATPFQKLDLGVKTRQLDGSEHPFVSAGFVS